jgi:hypothetical protein
MTDRDVFRTTLPLSPRNFEWYRAVDLHDHLRMSNELADRFERDLSASPTTLERARRARRRGAALDVNWVAVFDIKRTRTNLDPKRIVRIGSERRSRE